MENFDKEKMANDIKESILKQRRSVNKTNMILNILWGVSFGFVAAAMFAGLLHDYISVFMLVLWTFNGYLKGKSAERDKQIDLAEQKLLSVLEDVQNGKAEIIITDEEK